MGGEERLKLEGKSMAFGGFKIRRGGFFINGLSGSQHFSKFGDLKMKNN